VPYALALALFGAIFEIIPYIGPVIAAVPGVAIAFLVSPVMGFSVLAFYIIVQQIEGNVLAPQIIKRSVGLSPAVLIIAVLIGAKLGGGLGILLTIAVVMMLSIFVEDFLEKQTLRSPNV
jgi:predicted PurR-regulated permease PerM